MVRTTSCTSSSATRILSTKTLRRSTLKGLMSTSRSSTQTRRLTSTLWVQRMWDVAMCLLTRQNYFSLLKLILHIPVSLLLVLNPDNSYEMFIDQSKVSNGNLLNDMVPPVNPTKEIDDPNDSKPDDWDERAKIPDPEAVKPDNW